MLTLTKFLMHMRLIFYLTCVRFDKLVTTKCILFLNQASLKGEFSPPWEGRWKIKILNRYGSIITQNAKSPYFMLLSIIPYWVISLTDLHTRGVVMKEIILVSAFSSSLYKFSSLSFCLSSMIEVKNGLNFSVVGYC